MDSIQFPISRRNAVAIAVFHANFIAFQVDYAVDFQVGSRFSYVSEHFWITAIIQLHQIVDG